MAKVEGYTTAQFEDVRTLLEQQISSGNEYGASIALAIDGVTVIDIWGGYLDDQQTQSWEKDTITNIWSSTKTIAALAALIQVERGQLDLDAPVLQYWPEFAENGKDGVLVRHLLSHTSGLSGWWDSITIEQVQDLSVSVPRLAKQKPMWEPGTASGYHAITMGHLIGELVKRTSGKSMKQFVIDEIADPLNADFQIGALESDWPRVAPVSPPPPAQMDLSSLAQDSFILKTLANPALDATLALNPSWRQADMSAVNGHANARSLVRILNSITLGGSVDGKRLLSPPTIDRIFEEQANGIDLVVGLPIRFGIGFGLAGGATSQGIPWLPSGRVCFWGGWGGSLVLMDLDRKLTFAYVMNKMQPGLLGSHNSEAYIKAVYKALGVEGYSASD